MPLTNAGATQLARAIIGDSPTLFNNANAHLGVGDSNTAFAAAQTDLQAAVNKSRKPMESGYPQRSGLVLTFRSVWGTADGNYAWAEWGVFNAAAAADMLSRKVDALGTKQNTESRQLTVDVTLVNGDA
jgi:hypothetical protein